MAGTDAGTIYASIEIELNKLQSDMVQAQNLFKMLGKTTEESVGKATAQMSKLAQFGKTLSAPFQKLQTVLTNAFAPLAAAQQVFSMVKGAVDGIISSFNQWAKAAENGARETEKMNAVLNSTGASAWTTTAQLKSMALEIENATEYTRNEITAMQSALIGFRSITGEVFERTTKAIVDMSAVMGGDLVSTSTAVGKAIDTPVQGMTALSRQGFVFTEQEKEMVKALEEAGNHLEAQEYVLSAIEETFGGAATAIGNANGAEQRLQLATRNLNEELGRNNLGLTNWIKNCVAASKEAQAFSLKIRNDEADLRRMNEQLKNGSVELALLKERLKGVAEGTDEYTKLVGQIARAENAQKSLNREMAFANLSHLEDQLKVANDYYTKMGDQVKYTNGYMTYDPSMAKARLDDLQAQYDAQEKLTNQIQKTQEINGQAVQIENRQLSLTDQLSSLTSKIVSTQSELTTVQETNNQLVSLGLKDQKDATSEIASTYLQQASTLLGMKTTIDELTKGEGNMYDEATKGIAELEQQVADIRLLPQNEETMEQVSTLLARIAEWRVMQRKITDLQELYNTKQAETVKTAQELNAAEGNTARIQDKRQKLLDEYANTMKYLNSIKDAGLINPEEYAQRVLSAQQTLRNGLQNIIKEFGADAKNSPITFQVATSNETDIQSSEKIVQGYKDRTQALKDYQDKLKEAEVEKAQMGMNDVQRAADEVERENEAIRLLIADKDATEELKKAGEDLIRINNEIAASNRAKDLTDLTTSWTQKVEEQGKTEAELNEIYRARELLAAQMYSAEGAAYDALVKGINDYYNGQLKVIEGKKTENELDRIRKSLSDSYTEQIADNQFAQSQLNKDSGDAAQAEINRTNALIDAKMKEVEADEGLLKLAQILKETNQSLFDAQQLKGVTEATEDYNEKLAALNRNTKETQAAQRAQAIDAVKIYNDQGEKYDELIKAINEYYDELENQQAWDTFKQRGMQALQAVMDISNSLMTLMTTRTTNSVNEELEKLEKEYNNKDTLKQVEDQQQAEKDAAQERINILENELDEKRELQDEYFENRYEALRENLDKERQATLYAMGLVEADTEEQWMAEYERLLAAGDERGALEALNNAKVAQINAQFDQQQKLADEQKRMEEKQVKEQRAIEDQQFQAQVDTINASTDKKVNDDALARETEYNNKKAALEYKAAMATYNQQLLTAQMQIGMAALQALANNPWPWSIALATAAGIAAGVQVQVVRANKPKLQTFAEGGIIQGSTFTGDQILVRGNAGERVSTVNQQNQANDLLQQLLDGSLSLGGGNTTVNVPVSLDGKNIATVVADYFNNRKVALKKRAIIG